MREPVSKLDPIGSFVGYIVLGPQVRPPSQGASLVLASNSPAFSKYYRHEVLRDSGLGVCCAALRVALQSISSV